MKKDKTHIHWYPGHIAKAEKKLKEQLSLVDAVIEVIDARLPLSSNYDNISGLLNGKPRFLLVNKSDLVDKNLLKPYIEELKKRFEIPVIVTEAKNNKDIKSLGIGAQILKALGIADFKLLRSSKANELEYGALSGFNLRILECIEV